MNGCIAMKKVLIIGGACGSAADQALVGVALILGALL